MNAGSTPEEKKMLTKAQKDLVSANDIIERLERLFGSNIPADQEIKCSAASLAYLSDVVWMHSKTIISLNEMRDLKSVSFGDDIILDDPKDVAIFKLGLLAALKIMGNPQVSDNTKVESKP